MAKRARQQYREPVRPKPVEKVELSEKHLKLRIVLVVLLLIAGATGIGLGVSSCMSGEAGWQEIQSVANEMNCSEDLTFFYRLGESGASPASEKRALSGLYSQLVVKGYQLFTKEAEIDDVCNVAYINRHPNEEITVEEPLYRAFSQIAASGDRSLYLGPVYARYDDLFFCDDDTQTGDFDPGKNPEVAAEYEEAARFANDPDQIDLELLGSNKVRLKVSPEYLAWAKESGAEDLIDFFWMKNAFLTDYMVDALLAAGYARGYIASYDGFVRNLGGSGTSYTLSVYDRVDGAVYPAATMEYTGPMAIACLRDYPLSERDGLRYYKYADGQIRTSYLDAADGLCKSALHDLTCLSREKTCAEVALEMIPVYISDTFRAEGIAALKEKGVSSVYCENGAVLYNDPALQPGNLYGEAGRTYRAELTE